MRKKTDLFLIKKKETYLLCLINENYKGGGAERRLIRTLNKISSEDKTNAYYLITYKGSKTNIKNICNSSKLNFKIKEISNRKIIAFFNLFKEFNKMKKNSTVHFINPSIYYFPLKLISNLKKIKIVLSIVAADITQKNISYLENIFYKINFSLANKIDWLNSQYKTKWNKKWILKKSTQTYCSFTDIKRFNSDFSKKENLLLFCGRLVDIKQPLLFVQTINDLKEYLIKKKYKVIILGNGPLKEKIQEYINKHKLNNLIKLDETIDPSPYFKKSKIFLSLQSNENYPSQSVFEAIASRNLVIATDVGDTRLFLNNNESILVKSNLNEIKNAIIKGIEEYDKYKNKIDSLKERTEKKHNLKNSAKYFKKLYYD